MSLLKTAPVLASSPKQMLEPLIHWPVKATNLEQHPCPIVSQGLLGGCLVVFPLPVLTAERGKTR